LSSVPQAEPEIPLGTSPVEVLSWAADRYPGRIVFTTGFGVEGCALVDMIAQSAMAIEIATLDTGLLFPETYELWRKLESRYGIKVRGVKPAQSVAEQAEAHGERLWEHNPDLCCALRKVEPLGIALEGKDAWVTAIRRDQTRQRAGSQVVEPDLARPGRVRINPLVTWTSDDVWAYVRAYDVPVNVLHERGYPSIGCWPCTSPVAPGEDPRAGRWRGLEKTECGLHTRREPRLVLALNRR